MAWILPYTGGLFHSEMDESIQSKHQPFSDEGATSVHVERQRYKLFVPTNIPNCIEVPSSISATKSVALVSASPRIGEDFQAEIPEVGSDCEYVGDDAIPLMWKIAPEQDFRASDFVKGAHMCQMQSLKPGDIVLVRQGATDFTRFRCVISFNQVPRTDVKEMVLYPLVVSDGKHV